jgi:hypothetical protein
LRLRLRRDSRISLIRLPFISISTSGGMIEAAASCAH